MIISLCAVVGVVEKAVVNRSVIGYDEFCEIYGLEYAMAGLIRRYAPKALVGPLLRALGVVKKLVYFGFGRYCPVCGSNVRSFQKTGVNKRPDGRCPVCGAPERLRLAWLFLDRRSELFDRPSKKILHIAPEERVAQKLRAIAGEDYISADLDESRAMVKMDVTQIDYPDNSFDIIYCSHVLEHVGDDHKAIREFYRVLADDGFAIVQVPITADVTFEDASVTDPAERERVFGQYDHLRRYGPDVKQRLENAGFQVRLITPSDFQDVKNVSKMALKNSTLFLCEKNHAT